MSKDNQTDKNEQIKEIKETKQAQMFFFIIGGRSVIFYIKSCIKVELLLQMAQMLHWHKSHGTVGAA